MFAKYVIPRVTISQLACIFVFFPDSEPSAKMQWLPFGREIMTLGDRIRLRRTELGWTQDALAQKAQLSKGFLSDLENNKRNIGAEKLLDVAKVLGLSLDYLMTGEDGEPGIRERLEFPVGLTELASRNSLSFTQTLTLLQMQKQIVANRSAGKTLAADNFDWQKFYNSVKSFL